MDPEGVTAEPVSELHSSQQFPSEWCSSLANTVDVGVSISEKSKEILLAHISSAFHKLSGVKAGD